MGDPSTYWLTLTNIALGLVVLICCVAVAAGVLEELAARRKAAKQTEPDGEWDGAGDGHAFRLPQLGITMADGGEPLRKKEKR